MPSIGATGHGVLAILTWAGIAPLATMAREVPPFRLVACALSAA